MTEAVEREIAILWNWMRMDMEPEPANAIVAFGCYDEQIPLRAVELWRRKFAPIVVFSGGLGRNTLGLFQESEATRFAEIARGAGLPDEAILLEDRSSNSAQNLQFTKALLEERGISARRILAVHKPYMERRLFATAAVCWPEAKFIVTSPRVTIREHIAAALNVGMTERGVIETLLGDVQRMTTYAQRGFQIPQEIPGEVKNAYDSLIALGFAN